MRKAKRVKSLSRQRRRSSLILGVLLYRKGSAEAAEKRKRRFQPNHLGFSPFGTRRLCHVPLACGIIAQRMGVKPSETQSISRSKR